MSRGSGGSGWISYKFWSIVLLALIGVIVNKDIVKHNGFKNSSTGKFLADVGCYDFVYTYGKYSVDTFHVGKVYVEKNAPIAYKKTSDALQPAIAATKKGYLTADAYVREKTPIVVDKIEEFIPGSRARLNAIPGQVSQFFSWLRKEISSAFTRLVEFLRAVAEITVKAFNTVVKDVEKGRYVWYDVSAIAQTVKKTILA